MKDNYSNYQSSETAWRYDVFIADAERRIDAAERELALAYVELERLKAKPPKRELFNWSA